MTDLRAKIRELEADLRDRGIILFPTSRAGERAHLLWCRIKRHVFRGGAVEMTPSALRLPWHREELRRAKQILVEMELIRQRMGGFYILGRYDRLDELVHDSFLELKALEQMVISLSRLMRKSKTQR